MKKRYNFLKIIGDKIGINLNYFVKNGFWVVLNQLVTVITSLLVSIIFTGYLSKEIFGQYQLMLSFLGIFTILSVPGLNISIVRSVAKGFDLSYLRAVKSSLKFSLFSIPVFFSLSFWYYFEAEKEFSFVLIFCGLLFTLIYGFGKWPFFLQAKEKFAVLSKFQIIQNVILNGILILSAIFFSENLFLISFFYLIINAIFSIFWHFKILKSVKKKSEDLDCIPYGKYMTLVSFFDVILLYFDKIIIGFIDIQLLAVYTIGIKLFDVIKGFVKSFYSVSLPKFAKRNIKIEYYKILILMFIGFLASIFLYFISEPIIIFFYTENYCESAYLFRKIIFVLPFIFVNPLFTNKINVEKKKKMIILIRLIAPLCSVFFSIFVFIFTKNPEYFVVSKIYSIQLIRFFILSPLFFRK